MTQPPEDLALITARTLKHYDERAAEFWEGTRDHDVRQNIDALLRHVSGEPPLRILDFGCGPGRDLAAFRSLGHLPVGLEGSPMLAAMAREYSGCEVWEQDFLSLDLPAGRFDGIFANASLFHVPRQELPRILRELRATLKRQGVLFASNPRGNNEEGWNRGRYGTYHDLESWRTFLVAAGFSELEHYYRPPGLPLEQQTWLASVWRRNDGLRQIPATCRIREVHMKRVTGIGGVFFKAKDPAALGAWYKKHLGIDVQDWGGAAFRWADDAGNAKLGTTIWSVGSAEGDQFAPSKASFMINYRVADLQSLLAALRAEGCNVLEKTDDSEYGKFGWVLDPEGNKVELWQPPEGQ